MRTGAIAGLIAIIVLSSPALTQGFAAGITGCQTYAANAQDGTARCQTCYSGYILSADAKFCNQCPIGCVNCSPTGQCLSCGTGYYLSSTGVCNACGNGCSACDGNTCTQCLNGYYRTSNYCARCSNSCASCTSSGACTSCPSGYELKNGTCTVGSADAAGALLTLLIFFAICCCPLLLCCFCLAKAGQAAGSAGGPRYGDALSNSGYGYGNQGYGNQGYGNTPYAQMANQPGYFGGKGYGGAY